jgi:hypothetical protein
VKEEIEVNIQEEVKPAAVTSIEATAAAEPVPAETKAAEATSEAATFLFTSSKKSKKKLVMDNTNTIELVEEAYVATDCTHDDYGEPVEGGIVIASWDLTMEGEGISASELRSCEDAFVKNTA